jgi:hypothetical protein
MTSHCHREHLLAADLFQRQMLRLAGLASGLCLFQKRSYGSTVYLSSFKASIAMITALRTEKQVSEESYVARRASYEKIQLQRREDKSLSESSALL